MLQLVQRAIESIDGIQHDEQLAASARPVVGPYELCPLELLFSQVIGLAKKSCFANALKSMRWPMGSEPLSTGSRLAPLINRTGTPA